MGFNSRVSRVWGIGIVDRICRLKLDVEAVVEDANKEVYSFQNQRSLIYLKFVGGCTKDRILSQIIIISYYQYINFLSQSFLRRDYSQKSYHTQPCLGTSSEAFIAIFNSGYIL